MAGTPTKQNAGQIGQLKSLMRFLQHEFITSRLIGDVHWKRNIAWCWRDGRLVAFFRLRSLLGFLMKRPTKLDIAELLPPAFKKSAVPMSFLEATSYNAVVCAVQLNILLMSMNRWVFGIFAAVHLFCFAFLSNVVCGRSFWICRKVSGFQDSSLLHRSQAKNACLASEYSANLHWMVKGCTNSVRQVVSENNIHGREV